MSSRVISYSIKKIFLAYICVCIAVILISNYIMGISTVKPLSDDMKKTYEEQLDSAGAVFKEKIKDLEMISGIISDLYLKDGLIVMDSGIDKVIKELADSNEDVKGCLLINSENDMLKYGLEGESIDAIQLQLMCNKTIDKSGQYKWYNMKAWEDQVGSYLYSKYIIASTKFFSENNSMPPQFYVFYDKNSLTNIVNTDNGNSCIGIVEQENNMIYSNNEDLYNKIIYSSIDNMQKVFSNEKAFYNIREGGKAYTVAVYPIEKTSFKFIKIYSNGMDITYILNTIKVSVLTLLVLLLISFYVYKFIKKVYISPLDIISARMKSFDSNNNEMLPITENVEANLIVDGYNHMNKKINEFVQEVKKQEIDKKKFELNALRHQIKPHFLYNILNSIRILALDREQEKVSESIRLLGRILKSMLSGTEYEVKISDELDFIKDYINLMQIRFDGGLKVDYCVEDEVLDCNIPAFALQPVVENAIEHGLAKELSRCGENAKIFICAKRNGDFIEIEITDNGVGMSEEKLSDVIKNMEHANDECIGLYNVKVRLELIYKDKGSINIESKENLYTSVIFKVPYIR